VRYTVLILAHETTPVAASLTPQERLLHFEHFMAVTAAAVNKQLDWLRLGGAFLGKSGHDRFDQQIEAQIEANVEVATEYVGALAACGFKLMVRYGERTHALEALAFQPDDRCYSAGIITEEGQTLVPLNGANTLEIGGSHQTSPGQLRRPQSPTALHVIHTLPQTAPLIGAPLTLPGYDVRI
jgi:hypothetical protein